MARAGDRIAERLRALASPWELVCFVWLPGLLVAYIVWQEIRGGIPVGDFEIFRTAARAVLHGDSPYPPADPRALAHFDVFVYPPISSLLFAPTVALPVAAGRILILAVSIVSVFVALRLLGVRDWRCYAVALLSAPMTNAFTLGAITPFLLLGAAVLWRYRNRPAAAGAAAALTVVAKLFLWPLAVWLVVRGRVRAVALAAAVSVAAVFGGWALIGFAGLGSYPHILRLLSRHEASVSYSPLALLGSASAGSVWTAALLSVAVVVAVVVASRGADGERRSFAVAVVGALVATPILWLHYFVLLLVPLALYRPRLSPLWFVPLALWATPITHANGSSWRVVLALAVTGLVLAPGLVESARPGSGLRLRVRRGRTGGGTLGRAFHQLVRGAESA